MTAPFKTEADLCAAFLDTIPASWTAYPETSDWDLLLVHGETGVQIGIEAKLRLNAKVIAQAAESIPYWGRDVGPDYRAVLVSQRGGDFGPVCTLLGLTVMWVEPREKHVIYGSAQTGKKWVSYPQLPTFTSDLGREWLYNPAWHDFAPGQREPLPDYVPRVNAGRPAPLQLSTWKIAALRLCEIMDRRGALNRRHFAALRVSPSRWTQGSGWLSPHSTRGEWVPGPHWPGKAWRAQHPEVAAEIAASFDAWFAKLDVQLQPPAVQGDLLDTEARP